MCVISSKLGWKMCIKTIPTEGVSKYKCLIFEVNVGIWRAMSAYR